MKAVLLNGPPRSGKDTIGNIIQNALGPSDCTLVKFADPIIDFMQSMFGVSCADGFDKERPEPMLYGRSRREVAIAYSEKFCKPTFGTDFFGREAIKAVAMLSQFGENHFAVFTDSGFSIEARPLVQAMGPENIVQVRLTRSGCSFANDSRSYWSLPDVTSIEFANDMAIEELPGCVRFTLLPEIRRCLGLA